jgi:hypothetical protein
MLSPATSPAAAAGESGSTAPITGAGFGAPFTSRTPATTTIASRKFMVTPASITITFAASDLDSNHRDDGTGFGPKGTIASGSHGTPGSPLGGRSAARSPRSVPPSNAAIASSSREAIRTNPPIGKSDRR